jgi:hypothetical protein
VYRRIKIVFLFLIFTQAVHSVEEYYGRLWAVFTPARFLSGLFSENYETGFLIINIGLFFFGMYSWIASTRSKRISHQFLIWFWIFIETANGIVHPVLAVNRNSYFPGLITAPLLLVIAIYLAMQLLRYNRNLSAETLG